MRRLSSRATRIASSRVAMVSAGMSISLSIIPSHKCSKVCKVNQFVYQVAVVACHSLRNLREFLCHPPIDFPVRHGLPASFIVILSQHPLHLLRPPTDKRTQLEG